jgi:hypothetical protein
MSTITPNNSGGNVSAPNRAPAAKVIAGALANNRVAQALIAALGVYSISGAIPATSTSTTTDFSSLLVGDYLLHIPASPGSAQFAVVVTAGTAPFAATVGDLYLVMRAVNLDANNPIIPPPPAQLTGRRTGDGGLDF